jgi:hypothetical protein
MDIDVLVWAFERSGNFSVRSAYRLLMKEESRKAQERQGVGGMSDYGQWWKVLQKLQIPPKLRIFWWRVINGFLPSKVELQRRHVIQESHCEMCGNPQANLYHVVVECPWARCFWEEVRVVTWRKLPELHPRTWAKDLVCSQEEAALFMCGGWSLWNNRNAHNHGRTRWNLSEAARHTAKMVEDLLCLRELGSRACVAMGNYILNLQDMGHSSR